jgi:hypothetical protein
MQKGDIRIPLNYGTAVVSKDISPEMIEILKRLEEAAYQHVKENQ